MPRKPNRPATFQGIPTPPGKNIGRRAFMPSAKLLREQYSPEDAETLRILMAWHQAAGLLFLSGKTLPVPARVKELSERVRDKAGRNLWGWEDVAVDTGFPPEVLPYLTELRESALRPTAAFPADMRELSPRMAVTLLKGNYLQTTREVRLILDSVPWDGEGPGPSAWAMPPYLELDQALGLTLYGTAQDSALPLLGRVRLNFDQRPGYSRRATFIADALTDGKEPFALGLLRHTLFEDDLAPRILSLRDLIADKTRAVFAGLGAYLEDDFMEGYTRVADRLLRENWEVPAFDAEDPEPDAEAVVERLLLWHMHDNRVQHPEVLLGLALLTGLSPAAFTGYAVKDAERRGYTYIDPVAGERLAVLVEGVSASGNATRCAKEIRGHLAELMDVQAGKQELISDLARLSRARTLKDVFWEWADRLEGVK